MSDFETLVNSKIELREPFVGLSFLLHLFIDPLLAWWAYGIAVHQIHYPLPTLGYWDIFWLCLALQAIWPMDRSTVYRLHVKASDKSEK